MNLGIRGRQAIVCASSRGLGRACAFALAREGVDVVVNGRDEATLVKTAADIRDGTGVRVTSVAGDVTRPECRAALLAACERPDILVTNCGGPPLGDFRDWDRETWIAALDELMITPIMLIRSVIDGMIERRFGRIVNITSISVKMPAPDRGLTNGARGGLTGFIAGLARQVAVHNVTVNNILPGYFETARGIESVEQRAERAGQSKEAFMKQLLDNVPARRMGDPDEFGALCAFLCGQSSGYMTGQNLAIDGGVFRGTL